MTERTICVRVGWDVQWVGFPAAWQQKIDRVESNGNVFYKIKGFPPGATFRIDKAAEAKTYVVTLESIAKPVD
jgi:hypothetical protein